MKRTWMLLGVALAMGCSDSDDGDDDGNKDAAVADAAAQDAAADTGAADAAAATCTKGATDPVTDPGSSCTFMSPLGPVCVHYVGSQWTAQTAQAACDAAGKQGGSTGCYWADSFCARTAASGCRLSTGGLPSFLYGLPDAICMSTVMGTPVAQPTGGWPASYSTLLPAGDAGTAGDGGTDAATTDAAAGDGGS